MFPPFLLAKLYIKGSLKNTETGFEFSLKNIIDSAMLVSLGPVTVDGREYTGAAITMQVGEKIYNGAQVSRQAPIPVNLGAIMRILMTAEPLPPGVNRITAFVMTQEIGQVKFEISDQVS